MTAGLQDRLVSLILDSDRPLANKLIDDWATVHGYDKALIEVLNPALEKIGQLWGSGVEFSLAQGYVAGKVAEDILTKMAANKKRTVEKRETKGSVVIGNIEDDYHPLGRRMVGVFLQTSGWRIYDLGTDVLSKEFVDKAVEVGARVIGASAMMYTSAMNIRKLREEIDNRGLTGYLQLAVGGAVFNLRPELVEEVGGDGTAKNAIDASVLVEELWNNSIKKGERR